ncbi:MAG: hypothetical protein AAGF12_42290, partial [Myxococcota bacterium]
MRAVSHDVRSIVLSCAFALGVGWIPGCASFSGVDPRLTREITDLREALDRRVGHATVLEYRVLNHDGEWAHTVVVADGLFAERREHLETGGSHTFGEDAFGAWLKVGDGPVRAAGPYWRREARSRAALFGLRFLDPSSGEEAFYFPGEGETWEYVYRPRGGRTLTMLITGEALPVAWDHIDGFGRLNVCEDIEWKDNVGHATPAGWSCSSSNAMGNVAVSSFHELKQSFRATAPPHWAAPRTGRSLAPCLAEPIEVSYEHPLRPMLPAQGNQGPEFSMILDSGAFHTYLDEELA